MILSVTLGLVLLLGLSYAWLTLTLYGDKVNVLKSGTLSLLLNETSENGIYLENSVPVLDEVGQEYEPFTFTLTNDGTLGTYYEIYLDDVDLEEGEDRIDDAYLRYELCIDGECSVGFFTNLGINPDRILDSGYIEATEPYQTIKYTLKVWLSSTAGTEAMGKVMRTRLRVNASQLAPQVTATKTLVKKANNISVTSYTDGNTGEMYTFTHEAGEQQADWTEAELTDYRYIGSNPNNWVTFNGEDWRIIGVFTVEDGNGNKEQRLKIIRNERIGEYLWDNTTVESSSGKNRWSDARLQMLLNPGYEANEIGGSLYWNQGSGTCYSGSSDATKACDFTSTGLSTDAQGMIADTKWYLGGFAYNSTTHYGTKEEIYQTERGTTVYSSTSYPRETNWTGKVGLMYPSDYAYTYGFGVDTTCDQDVYKCNTSTPSSGWLYNSSYAQWTLSPYSAGSNVVLYVSYYGYVRTNGAGNVYGVRPVVYLRSDIQIQSGDGTADNKYVLA